MRRILAKDGVRKIEEPKVIRGLTSFQTIILGFAGLILLGALLLCLPIASREGKATAFSDTLFTATSAACVTGLVVKDTASYWSEFGQTIILILIQIGGMGVITFAAAIVMISGRKIKLMQRNTLKEAISAPRLGGVVRFARFITLGTLVVEGIGAVIMAPVFCKKYGAIGLWKAFFTSISAFCNAGFDLCGTKEAPFVSLVGFANNPVIVFTITTLILVGGIGFMTWADIKTHGRHMHKYSLQTKVVLMMTAILVVVPTLIMMYEDFQEESLGKGFMHAYFQAVTPRTAGFNTVDLNSLSASSKGLMVMLMLIGGASGSTAGGMKVATVAVLVANAIASFKRKDDAVMFNRRINNDVIKNASTIFVMYLALFLGAGIIICSIEGLPISDCMFESASAIATVGLTLGITTKLHMASRIILICLMFIGRVGGLTLIYAALSRGDRKLSRFPEEHITVG